MANGWTYHEMCLFSTKWVYFDIGENKTFIDILSILKYFCSQTEMIKEELDWSKLYLNNVAFIEVELDDFMNRKPNEIREFLINKVRHNLTLKSHIDTKLLERITLGAPYIENWLVGLRTIMKTGIKFLISLLSDKYLMCVKKVIKEKC